MLPIGCLLISFFAQDKKISTNVKSFLENYPSINNFVSLDLKNSLNFSILASLHELI